MKHKQQSRKSRNHHHIIKNRGPKHLIHDVSESYYDGIDSDIYGDIYGSKLSAEERCYIDPWDLENYDYVRKKLSASSIDETSIRAGVDCITSPVLPTGEPTSISPQFFYLPNSSSPSDCRACYAGFDDHSFYNNITKYETIYDEDMIYSDFDSPYRTDDLNPEFSSFSSSSNSSSSLSADVEEEEENSSAMLSTSLKLHTPGFGVAASARRKLTLPKPVPQLEFPAPPPYDYCIPYGDALMPNYGFDCYECMSNMSPIYGTIPASQSDLYGGSTGSNGTTSFPDGYSSFDSTMSQPSSLYSTYSNRFEISKKGLLQIDYSCNWNDLDRLIGKDI